VSSEGVGVRGGVNQFDLIRSDLSPRRLLLPVHGHPLMVSHTGWVGGILPHQDTLPIKVKTTLSTTFTNKWPWKRTPGGLRLQEHKESTKKKALHPSNSIKR